MTIEQLSALITITVTLGSFWLNFRTAHMNNQHQLELKKLEYSHTEKKEQQNHKRQIFENYITAAGACVHYGTQEDIHDFGVYSSLAIFYAPDSLQPKMIQLQQMIDDGQRKQRPGQDEALLLNEIILELQKWNQQN